MTWDALYAGVSMRRCAVCGQTGMIAEQLGVCLACIRRATPEAAERVAAAHVRARKPFGLPGHPPRSADGAQCKLCVNRCQIGEDEKGYCGSKINRQGRIQHLWGAGTGLLDWYYDPIPTNCVAAWICGARHDYGCRNLAVFLRACSFDCLYCQNWHFKAGRRPRPMTAADLAARANNLTSCICYFGGDPAPQAPYSLLVARLALARRRARPLRICWETNGSENPAVMRTMGRLALVSGGTIKIDLKAIDDRLHQALTGSSNAWTLENIRLLAAMMADAESAPPLLVVSTLLVPGYVDADEVAAIARFLAALNPSVPYALLAFHPQFLMADLPPTSRQHAQACHQAAMAAGLRQARLGNVQLLW